MLPSIDLFTFDSLPFQKQLVRTKSFPLQQGFPAKSIGFYGLLSAILSTYLKKKNCPEYNYFISEDI
jgi:hypothetical protein